MKALLAAAAFLSIVSAADITIYHRIFHPSLPAQPYLERGSVTISDSSTFEFVPSPHLTEDLLSFTDALKSFDKSNNVLYQVALQHPEDTSEALWDFSSVKLCFLSKIASETLLLHLSGGHEPEAYALDYFVAPTPSDGSCPLSKSKKAILPTFSIKSFANRIQTLNTTIIIKGTETPPLPQLRVPPPINAEGEVVMPVPEKSFLQKYWMYIGAVLLVILVTGGGEEEAPKRS